MSLSSVRFDAAHREIWFFNEETGVHIVQFTNNAYPLPTLPRRDRSGA